MPCLLPPFQTGEHRPAPCTRPTVMHSLSCPVAASRQFCLRSPPPLPVSERCISVPCTPTPRRRARGCLVSQRRRRHGPRVECRSEGPQLLQHHVFDKLPWIASLDQPLNDNVHPADFADLSQLPDPVNVLPHHLASGPGPIRHHRKPQHSLRSTSPLLLDPSTPTRTRTRIRAAADDDNDDDDHLFHLNYNLFARDIPSTSRPSTPMSRIRHLDPARVTFRHLMPVAGSVTSDDDDDD